MSSKQKFPLELDFFSYFVHELKAPLIRLKLQLDQVKKKSPQENQLDFVEKEMELLFQFIQDGLEISQLDSPFELKKEWCSWESFLNSVQEKLKNSILHSSVHLEVSQKEEMEVYIDPFWMHSAVSNLLLNAIQHSPKNGRVKMKSHFQPNDSIIFSISDEGPGIEENLKEKLFQKFQSTRKKQGLSLVKGTGLGLYIAKSITQSHGGSVSAGSLSKGGSIFSLTLPQARRLQSHQAV